MAERLPNKSPKQCRERYENVLAPNIPPPWTPWDDARLVQGHHFFCSDCVAIAAYFPGRTNDDVKNRFNSHCRWKRNGCIL
ncbi:MAG: hypothetical protein LBD32_00590 [Cytophagales bacterium]|nr:hypothetical protein [Cytophagales bacterium]